MPKQAREYAESIVEFESDLGLLRDRIRGAAHKEDRGFSGAGFINSKKTMIYRKR